MTISPPELTSVINLLIAVGIFASVVSGLLWKLRQWQRNDVKSIVDEALTPLSKSVETLLEDVAEIKSTVKGHEGEIGVLRERTASLEGAVFKRPPIREDN